MTIIIRRYRRPGAARLWRGLAVACAGLVAAWLFMAIWTKGGPQPVHRIVVAIPAPQMPAAAGRQT